MDNIRVNYDSDADVLYVAFSRSEHVIGIELTDNIILRLDKGELPHKPAKAVGLTFISFSHILRHYQERPLSIPLANLRHLPDDLWQAVLAVITTPPVSDFLSVGLSLAPQVPPLPELEAA